MITVYHMRGARGVRILWCCEEMGLPYEVRPVSFTDKPPEYAGLNPAMTIPLLVDGGVVMVKSAASVPLITTAGGLPMAPASPQPFTPNGLWVQGVTQEWSTV